MVRSGRESAYKVEMLEPRLCPEPLSALRRGTAGAGVGVCDRVTLEDVEERRDPKERWKLRSGDGELNMPCVW